MIELRREFPCSFVETLKKRQRSSRVVNVGSEIRTRTMRSGAGKIQAIPSAAVEGVMGQDIPSETRCSSAGKSKPSSTL